MACTISLLCPCKQHVRQWLLHRARNGCIAVPLCVNLPLPSPPRIPCPCLQVLELCAQGSLMDALRARRFHAHAHPAPAAAAAPALPAPQCSPAPRPGLSPARPMGFSNASNLGRVTPPAAAADLTIMATPTRGGAGRTVAQALMSPDLLAVHGAALAAPAEGAETASHVSISMQTDETLPAAGGGGAAPESGMVTPKAAVTDAGNAFLGSFGDTPEKRAHGAQPQSLADAGAQPRPGHLGEIKVAASSPGLRSPGGGAPREEGMGAPDVVRHARTWLGGACPVLVASRPPRYACPYPPARCSWRSRTGSCTHMCLPACVRSCSLP